jgi:hypothetical protein
MAGWIKADLAAGKMTQTQADKAFAQLNTPLEQRGPDTHSDEQKLLDAQFPAAKPEDYIIHYGIPGQEPEMTKELKAFGTSARTWMSSAGLPRELGNSLVTTIAKVAQQTQRMTADQLETYGYAGVRVGKNDREEKLELIFRPQVDAAIAEAVRDIKNILGLDLAARDFRVTYGAVPANDKEVAFLTRSILEVLTDLSSRIKVPEVHVRQHRVGPTPDYDLGPEGPILDLIRITSSEDRPDNAFVATPYRGYWFSIDDQDVSSKRLFTFLMFLFTFVETPGGGAPPILTIPASR